MRTSVTQFSELGFDSIPKNQKYVWTMLQNDIFHLADKSDSSADLLSLHPCDPFRANNGKRPLRELSRGIAIPEAAEKRVIGTHLQLERSNLALGPASLSAGDKVARPLAASGEAGPTPLVLNTIQVDPRFSATIRNSIGSLGLL